MWQNKIVRQFQSIPANPDVSEFLGPYNKLLYTLFLADSDYMVVPRYLVPTTPLAVDLIVTFEILFVDKPVFILELKAPADMKLVSTRRLADLQIGERMADLYCRSSLSLHG
jgi:hypothetical protein